MHLYIDPKLTKLINNKSITKECVLEGLEVILVKPKIKLSG
jgi:hypothetical protein